MTTLAGERLYLSDDADTTPDTGGGEMKPWQRNVLILALVLFLIWLTHTLGLDMFEIPRWAR